MLVSLCRSSHRLVAVRSSSSGLLTELLHADGDDISETGRAAVQTTEDLDALDDLCTTVIRHQHASAELNHGVCVEGGAVGGRPRRWTGTDKAMRARCKSVV